MKRVLGERASSGCVEEGSADNNQSITYTKNNNAGGFVCAARAAKAAAVINGSTCTWWRGDLRCVRCTDVLT